MPKKSITIQEARRMLGKQGEKLSDKQVANLIAMLRAVCNKVIDATIGEK